MYCKEACPAHAIVGNVWRQGVERDCIVNVLKCRETARKIAKQAIGKEITLQFTTPTIHAGVDIFEKNESRVAGHYPAMSHQWAIR